MPSWSTGFARSRSSRAQVSHTITRRRASHSSLFLQLWTRGEYSPAAGEREYPATSVLFMAPQRTQDSLSAKMSSIVLSQSICTMHLPSTVPGDPVYRCPPARFNGVRTRSAEPLVIRA